MKRYFRVFLHFPLTRIVVAVLLIVALTSGAHLSMEETLRLANLPHQLNKLLSGIFSSFIALFTYFYLFRIYEKRKITELSSKNISFNLGLGIFLGAILQGLTILVIWLFGGFEILAINPVTILVMPFVMAFTSAIFEELIVRGIIFRILEEKSGTLVSLVISAAIFGALHLANPNSSLLAATGLALQAGVFLAAAFIYTRNLWFPIAIHFAWNFTQGGIFGASISGGKVSASLFTTSIHGETLVTGGAFGPEGSLQATVFCFSAALILLYFSWRKGLWIKPWWKLKQKKEETTAVPSS